MQRLSLSTFRSAARLFTTLWLQWRNLHAQSWGWGPDEQPPIADEPEQKAPKTEPSLVASGL